jgi:hypothetical protein
VTPALAAGGLASGLLAGLLSGVFGIGGGIVLVPLLALLLGVEQHRAQGVTLAVLLLPVGLPAVLAYRRLFPIRWRLVGGLVAGFLPGVASGSLAANHIPGRPLQLLFSLLLLATALRTWRGAEPRPGPAPARQAAGPWTGLWIGAVGGALAGLLGIGGGLAMVPLLVEAAGLSQHEAQGASLATMLPPVGLPGVLVYSREQGGLPWDLMAAVAAGFMAGALAGARVAGRVRPAGLSRAFAVLLACVGAVMAWRSLSG